MHSLHHSPSQPGDRQFLSGDPPPLRRCKPSAAAAAFSVSTRPSSTLFSLESHEAGCSGEFQFEELSRGQKTRYFHRAYPLPLGWCHLGIDLRTEASQ